jgi:hypothetical protein
MVTSPAPASSHREVSRSARRDSPTPAVRSVLETIARPSPALAARSGRTTRSSMPSISRGTPGTA